jgi:hypothetical protein
MSSLIDSLDSYRHAFNAVVGGFLRGIEFELKAAPSDVLQTSTELVIASLPVAGDAHAVRGEGEAVAEVVDDDSGIDLVALVSTGQFTPPVRHRLQSGFSSFRADDADRPLSLERYLRLSSGAAARRKSRRNSWLMEVAKEYEHLRENPWSRAGAVFKALDEFQTRGAWLAWRDEEDPPPGTSELRTALFRVCQNMKKPDELSQKTISRVIGQNG